MRRPNLVTPLVLLLIVAAVSVIEFYAMRLGSLPVTARVFLLILFNLTIIALLTLIFFVAKALTKLYLERKQKVLGSKFRTKIVVIFVILTSIPSILLFLGATGLVSRYIDRWFTPQFRQPLDSIISIAKSIYDTERKKSLEAAHLLVSKGTIIEGYTVTRLTEIPDNASDVIIGAFNGEEGTEVITGRDGDAVRAAVPVFSGKRITGVVVVESLISSDIVQNIEAVGRAYEDYIALESWKQPLKLNYLLFLGFFTLLVIFTALWASLRIARAISEPIRKLAEATNEVASGNLNIDMQTQRDDEIGLLMNSFGHMVAELRESKESLQTAYKESDRRRLSMETILENIQSGVISLDADGKVITINNAACAILNLDRQEVIGKNYEEILSVIQSDALQEMVKGINLRTLRAVGRAVPATIKGKRLMLRVSIMGLRDKSNYLGLLVVFDDLTDLIKAQRALAWQEVARRIAHEIKNPLTPIKLSTERMFKKWEHKDRDFDEVFERSTKTIIKEVEGLRHLVDEFTRFGRMPEIQKAPTMLAGIIEEIVALYSSYKGFDIRVSLPEQMPSIDIDGEKFKRVLINLIENARQAMNGSGTVALSVICDLPANQVFINVADNGPGIREEDKDKLFLPYFSTKKSGAGLGLANAYKVVTDHLGYIRVADNHPHGTVFTIELPIKES